MSVKISRITFKQLRNSEFTLFVGQVVIITQKHEPDALNLTKSFNNVLSLMADLSKIKAKELSSKLSPVLHELDAERDSLSTGIIAIIKAVGLMKKSPFASQVLVLNHFFDTQRRDIADDNYNSETQRINNLFAAFDSKPEVQTAAATMNLTVFFEQMRTANAQFGSMFMKRNEEIAALGKVDTQAIRSKTNKALTTFFDAIRFNSAENDTLNYAPLANEVNDLVSKYKTQIKARATRRKASKELSKVA